MGLIYMRISPSGGKYIGQTIRTEAERWNGHCREAHNLADDCYNSILNKAIRKYGDNNFQVQILENNIDSENLDEREIYWISYYHTYYKDNCHGYNMTLGGQLGAKVRNNSIPVLQYDLQGNFIKQWSSASEVAHSEIFKTKNTLNNLSRVLNHDKLTTYYNFLWKYIDDEITPSELVNNYKRAQAKKSYKSTAVYCVENNTIYYSFSQAAKELGISRKMISKYAKLNKPEPKTNLHFKIMEK